MAARRGNIPEQKIKTDGVVNVQHSNELISIENDEGYNIPTERVFSIVENIVKNMTSSINTTRHPGAKRLSDRISAFFYKKEGTALLEGATVEEYLSRLVLSIQASNNFLIRGMVLDIAAQLVLEDSKFRGCLEEYKGECLYRNKIIEHRRDKGLGL